MKREFCLVLAATCLVISACTHIRIHDLDTSAPDQTVGTKNTDVAKWLQHYEHTDVAPIRFCNVDDVNAGSICDQSMPPADGRVVFSFIHLSDVQLYDERVVIVSRAISRVFDLFVSSARLDPAQAKHDTSVYLALIEAINTWNDSLCEANEGATAYNPMFVVHTGDEIHADVYQELWEFLHVSARLQLPWFPLIGNHDVMTFGTRPAARETVTKIETDRPSLAMNLVRTPQEFMSFHNAGRTAALPPGMEFTLPSHTPSSPTCDAGVRGAEPVPDEGNPFDEFEIAPGRGGPVAGSACAVWNEYERSLVGRPARPGYYSWSFDSDLTRIPESWRDRTLAKNVRLRFLFLNTAQDITFSSGGMREDQLAWARCQLERAEENNEYVLAFGHHPLSNLFSKSEGVGFRHADYSRIAQLLIDSLAENTRFLGYFTGHTHRYENHEVCSTSGRCFHEIQAPSAVQQVPQAGLLVRVVEPRLTQGEHAILEVHPFLGPYVEDGYSDLDCKIDSQYAGEELPDLEAAARLGSLGALRHLGCQRGNSAYQRELKKLKSLYLETGVATPMTP